MFSKEDLKQILSEVENIAMNHIIEGIGLGDDGVIRVYTNDTGPVEIDALCEQINCAQECEMPQEDYVIVRVPGTVIKDYAEVVRDRPDLEDILQRFRQHELAYAYGKHPDCWTVQEWLKEAGVEMLSVSRSIVV